MRLQLFIPDLMGKVIRVFEHQSLYIDDEFHQSHWKSLANYNERHGSKYFTLLPDGVRFNQHVGVIQAGSLTIEILPKVQKLSNDDNEDKAKWRNILLHMLHECRLVRVAHPELAALKLYSGTILEAYLQRFLDEVNDLLHEGLSKRYRNVSGNLQALKGRFEFGQHIRKNLVHAERFYVRHTVYDREHIIHAILYKALLLINQVGAGHHVKANVGRLLLDFPEMPDVDVSLKLFEKLSLSRNEHRYGEALLIAKMLLLNLRPDIQRGEENVLALLFDMNSLWEEYVYRQLVKIENSEFSVDRQQSTGFWHLEENETTLRTVRPDLIVVYRDKQIVVDTKWKLIEDNEPSDEDLKQMFAYAHYFDSSSVMLLYPSMKKARNSGRFAREHAITVNKERVFCSIVKVPIKYEEGIGLDINASDFQV